MTSFVDTSLLVGKQKVVPIVSWEEATSQLEAWAVFCMVFLGDKSKHPATYEMLFLIEETSVVSLRMRVQVHQQTTFPASLLCLIKKEFSKRFHQALDRWQMVWWPNFESMRRALVTGNFRPELVALPRGVAPPERPLPPTAAPRRQALATPQT